MPPLPSADELANPTRLGRLLSILERGGAEARELLAALPPETGAEAAQIVGLTGSPGVGKSTLAGRLIEALLERGERVAVLAVDPSSPLSGGAVLGDRVRMQQATESGSLFIRSLASRGSLGGLSSAAFASARLLQAAGFKRILIETVGVGQTGDDISGLADCIVVLLSPEGGDGLQMIKAGLLELGDLFVVNKSDRPGAEALLSELRFSVGLGSYHEGDGAPAWTAPVLAASAAEGSGTAEIVSALDAHRQWLIALPPEHPARRLRLARRLRMRLRAELAEVLDAVLRSEADPLAAALASGALNEEQALDLLRASVARRLADKA